jgi:hypothetical protein
MRCVPTLTRLSSGAPSIIAVLVQLAVLLPATVAAESLLRQDTVTAYNVIAARVERRFVAAARRDTPAITSTLLHGKITVEPATGDGILKVPDGLVHHSRGAAFIPGVTLADVLRIARSYDEYSAIYDSVVASRLVAHHGNTYETLMRIAKSEGPFAAVLDIHSTVTYETVTSQRAFSVSVADRIREIRNAGRRDERPLPSGHGRGYLWRAHVFSLFIANGEGVYVATETLGLSRRFPRLLAWAIEPVARRLGRNSVEGSLAALREAVIARMERPAHTP